MGSINEGILRELKEAGYKFTDKRKAIVDLFVDKKDKYMTAKDVFEEIKQSYPAVSFDTVYRTLSLLVQHNFIERLEFSEDASKYRLMCKASSHHHHHLICMRCGTTKMVDECPMELLKGKVGDFKITDHRFEIFGYCGTCSQ